MHLCICNNLKVYVSGPYLRRSRARPRVTGEKTTTVGLKTVTELEAIVKILLASDSNKFQADFSFLGFEGSQCNLMMTLFKMTTLFEKTL